MPDLYGNLTPQGVLNGSLQTIVYADNYNDLINKPSINSVELQGNKTAADLGLLTAGDIPVDSVNGKQGVVILDGDDIEYSAGVSLSDQIDNVAAAIPSVPVLSVNSKTGAVVLDGDDIEYEPGTSVNSKITDLEAEIGSGPVISVNGQQGVVELDGTDINYSLTKTLNQKIDEVAASIPVVSYPVTSVNTKTGDVVLDGDDIDYAEGVTVNDQIGTNATNIGNIAADVGDLDDLTTSVTSSLVGAVNEVVSNKADKSGMFKIQTFTKTYSVAGNGSVNFDNSFITVPTGYVWGAVLEFTSGQGQVALVSVRPNNGSQWAFELVNTSSVARNNQTFTIRILFIKSDLVS